MKMDNEKKMAEKVNAVFVRLKGKQKINVAKVPGVTDSSYVFTSGAVVGGLERNRWGAIKITGGKVSGYDGNSWVHIFRAQADGGK